VATGAFFTFCGVPAIMLPPVVLAFFVGVCGDATGGGAGLILLLFLLQPFHIFAINA
jgi:hypothetical protein